MEDKINDIIIDHLGLSVFVFCVVIIGIVFVSIWCYKIYQKVSRMDNLPCEHHTEKMGEHDKAVVRIETSISYLTKEIDTAMRSLQKQNIQTDGFTQTNSPLSITEKGWEMIHRIGLDKMFENNWERIETLINSEVESPNAYDIV